MSNTNFNEFCKGKDCPQFVEWSIEGGDCTSCRLVGQSYNIEEYPKECHFLSDIQEFERQNKIEQ